DVVALAEPAVEERLLEEVDVLVLVDRERVVARAEGLARRLVLVIQADGELEQVLEVEKALRFLAALVAREDARHEVGRDRGLVLAEPLEVRRRPQAAVLRPLDLIREVGERAKAERPRERARALLDEERLRREDGAGPLRSEMMELSERGRVKGSRRNSRHAEAREPGAHLAGGLVGERDGEDLGRGERASHDLVGDAARYRRRLAGARAGQDADRPAHRLDRAALLRVQALEDPGCSHRSTLGGRSVARQPTSP